MSSKRRPSKRTIENTLLPALDPFFSTSSIANSLVTGARKRPRPSFLKL